MKMKQLSEAIEIMKMNIKQQVVVVKTAEQRLEIARIRLNEAMIERKTHERLKENAWHEYLMDVTAEEQKILMSLTALNITAFCCMRRIDNGKERQG